MSDEERHAMIGRALEQHTQTKYSLDVLSRRAWDYASRMDRVGTHLRALGGGLAWHAASQDISSLPSQNEIQDLASEILKKIEQKEELRRQLRDLGMTDFNEIIATLRSYHQEFSQVAYCSIIA